MTNKQVLNRIGFLMAVLNSPHITSKQANRVYILLIIESRKIK